MTQRRWPFAAKLTCFESTYTVVEDLFSRRFSWLFLSFRSSKFGTPLFAIKKSFGVSILAKCCGSFNTFNTYFLRNLDSRLFFR